MPTLAEKEKQKIFEENRKKPRPIKSSSILVRCPNCARRRTKTLFFFFSVSFASFRPWKEYLYSRYRPNRGYDGSSIIPAGWFKLTRSDQQKSKNLIPKNTIPCHYSNRFLFLKCCTHTYHGWRELLTASFRLLSKHHMTVFSTYYSAFGV